MKNVFYSSWICPIGGLESFFYYLVKTHPFPKWDITIMYDECDLKQLKRLSKYCNVIKAPDVIECDTFWCNFNKDVLDKVKAKHINLVLHGDYYTEVMNGNMIKENLPLDPRVERYFGVTQRACDGWKKLTGKDATLIYNPIELELSERPLQFVSATRLSKEKGGKRMIKLMNALDNAGIKYDWHVFTTGHVEDENKTRYDNRFIIHRPTLDIASYIKEADALIQLSDSEGFGYSIVEAEMLGKPVIVTRLPVLNEINVNESNAIILDFDMKDIPIEKIRNIRDFKVNYTPPKSEWDKFLVEGEGKEKIKLKTFLMEANEKWLEGGGIICPELGRVPNPGDRFEVSEERAKALVSKGRTFIVKEIVEEEVPKEPKKRKK